MITENLSTLKIHKLTQEQYVRELEAGRIDESAIYLTPYEEIDLSGYATQAQFDSLSSEIANKSSTGHKHTKSEITDFPTSMAPTAHTHVKSEITDFPTTELWTFTLEDGSTVTKVVYVG